MNNKESIDCSLHDILSHAEKIYFIEGTNDGAASETILMNTKLNSLMLLVKMRKCSYGCENAFVIHMRTSSIHFFDLLDWLIYSEQFSGVLV